MSQTTGKQIHSFVWTKLTINDQVVYRVINLATKEEQSKMTKGYPIFEWIPGIPIIDKYNETKHEDNKIVSTHEYDKYNDITENG